MKTFLSCSTSIRLLAAALAVCVAGTVLAQAAQSSQTSSNKAGGGADSMFIAGASAGGMTEVQASQLAATHASSSAVKAFAQTMVTDHGKANQRLTELAQKDGLKPAATPTGEQQAALSRLQALQGGDFDRAYASMMVKDHKGAIALFKQEAAHGQQSDLKAFASETLPTIEHHLSMTATLPTTSGQ